MLVREGTFGRGVDDYESLVQAKPRNLTVLNGSIHRQLVKTANTASEMVLLQKNDN
jgi:hypothetical protein